MPLAFQVVFLAPKKGNKSIKLGLLKMGFLKMTSRLGLKSRAENDVRSQKYIEEDLGEKYGLKKVSLSFLH